MLGGLGIEYCIKSEKAYGQLREVNEGLLSVLPQRIQRQATIRGMLRRAAQNMRHLIDSDASHGDQRVQHVALGR